MAYEMLTGLAGEISGDVEEALRFPDGAMCRLEQALCADEFSDTNYFAVLERAGISAESADPNSYDWDAMGTQEVLALLTAAVRAERFTEGTQRTCLETGLYAACLNKLAQIDCERGSRR